jgi:hypothetical protein
MDFEEIFRIYSDIQMFEKIKRRSYLLNLPNKFHGLDSEDSSLILYLIYQM